MDFLFCKTLVMEWHLSICFTCMHKVKYNYSEIYPKVLVKIDRIRIQLDLLTLDSALLSPKIIIYILYIFFLHFGLLST